MKPGKVDVYWNRALGILSVLVLICVAAVAIVTIVMVNEGFSYQRYCLDNDQYLGQMELSSNSRSVSYDIQYLLPSGEVVTALKVFGPILPGQTEGSLHLTLCGVPSDRVCDTSVGAVLRGSVEENNEASIKVSIAEIRDFPRRFYLALETSLNTTGLRAPLGTLCGSST